MYIKYLILIVLVWKIKVSATANKASHCLKWDWGLQNQEEPNYFDKIWSDASDGRFGNLILIRNANGFDKSPNSNHQGTNLLWGSCHRNGLRVVST